MKKIFTLIALTLGLATTAVAQDTWTVAGTSAALNGTADWDPTNTENDMTLQGDGTYQLVVTNCTLESTATYQFKVCKNHAWTTAYPSSNKTFNVSETAVYTVTYTFAPDNNNEVSVATAKTGNAGEITHTYTVCGVAALCGSDWNPADETNDMTLQADGSYQLVKTGVALAVETNYEYKVAQDHAWGQSWPSSNAILTVDETASYDVTFSFVPSTGTVSAEVVKKGTAVIEETYIVAGSSTELFGTAWDATNENNKMTEQDNGDWVKVYDSVDLTAGTIKYKFVHNGSTWLPNDNQELVIEQDGNYKVTFTYIYEDQEVQGVAEYLGPKVGIESVATGKNTFVWYDLQGRSVKAPAKGLYIRDGKKVILK